MKLDLKYGVNPNDTARVNMYKKHSFKSSDSCSLNSYIDYFVGQQVSNSTGHTLVYLKHGMPVFAFGFSNNRELKEKIKLCHLINKDREFGTYYFCGKVDLDFLYALNGFRYHTIVAIGYDFAAKKHLASKVMQETNRGVIYIESDVASHEFANNNSILISLSLENQKITSNICKGLLPSRYVYLEYMRTIGSIAINYRTGDLLTTTAGEFSPSGSLSAILDRIKYYQPQLEKIELATDGCFGVEDPSWIKRESIINKLTLFGEKNSESRNFENWGEKTELSILPNRAFSYFI